ncbi:MAG: hypothetical protein ABIH99_02575 [Candidatus Micrarchaeota archaeon]
MENEVCRMGKTFVCECGAKYNFDFSTDLVLNSMEIDSVCEKCGCTMHINLDSFLRNRKSAPRSLASTGFMSAVSSSSSTSSAPQASSSASTTTANVQSPLSFMDEKDVAGPQESASSSSGSSASSSSSSSSSTSTTTPQNSNSVPFMNLFDQ